MVLPAVAFFLAGAASGQSLSALQKAYFAATPPGSWARYDQTTTDQRGKTTTCDVTLSRLENEDGQVWIEMRRVPKPASSGRAVTFKYLLNPDFKVEKNALDYLKFIDRAITQEDGKNAVEMPWDMMRSMAGGLGEVDYSSSATPKGTEPIGDRLCDHYHLLGSFDARVLFAHVKGKSETDLWLSDAVPFGRVKEISESREDSGKPLGKTEWMLVETGSGAKSRITGQVRKLGAPGR